jgi:hypothetical protein
LGTPPRARGLTQSCYQLDSLTAQYTCSPLDESWSWDPAPANSNPAWCNPQQGKTCPAPTLAQAFEGRYGRCTIGSCIPDHFFKRFKGPSNEVKFMVRDALAWLYRTNRVALGGDTTGRSGVPTDQEVTDAQATDDQFYVAYMQSELDGYSEGKPKHYNDPTAACGLRPPVVDRQWGLSFWYFNDAPCGGVAPTPTPAPTPVVDPSPPPPVATPTPPINPPAVCTVRVPAQVTADAKYTGKLAKGHVLRPGEVAAVRDVSRYVLALTSTGSTSITCAEVP